MSSKLEKVEGGHKSASSTTRRSKRVVIKKFAKIQRRMEDRRLSRNGALRELGNRISVITRRRGC